MVLFARPRRVVALVLLLLAGAFALTGLIAARADPLVRHLRFVSARLAPATPPFRIVLISDIHVGNLATPVWRLNRVVDRINALNPDAVVFAGDLVNGYAPDDARFRPDLAVAPLRRLTPRLGVWAVLGNHDEDDGEPLVRAALARAHIHLLDDQAARVGPLALVGMRRFDVNPPRMPRVMQRARALGGLPILVTHSPPFSGFVPRDVALVLTGHTHCGQIVLFGWDNSFDPFEWRERWPSKWRCGLVDTGAYPMVVTAGIGAASEIPLRVNAPSDMWAIDVVPAMGGVQG